MASKYLSAGTATYTATTTTVSGATMNAAFASGDVGKSVAFRIGTALYWGTVKSYVSGTSVILHSASTLPSGNGTIDDLFLLDQGSAHGYQDYLDRIQTMVQDDVDKLSVDDRAELLAAAVTDYGEDKAFYARVKVAGDGTQSYNLATMLGSQWRYGYTVLTEVEYPSGDVPATILEREDWIPYDDGTAQDGSNVVLRFLTYTPAVGEYFVVKFRVQPTVPVVGNQNFPDNDTHFQNVCLLASAYWCMALASAYALSTDSTLTGDVVNYSDKSDKYRRLATMWLERYNQSVFGDENPTSSAAAATVSAKLSQRASDRGSFLFH